MKALSKLKFEHRNKKLTDLAVQGPSRQASDAGKRISFIEQPF